MFLFFSLSFYLGYLSSRVVGFSDSAQKYSSEPEIPSPGDPEERFVATSDLDLWTDARRDDSERYFCISLDRIAYDLVHTQQGDLSHRIRCIGRSWNRTCHALRNSRACPRALVTRFVVHSDDRTRLEKRNLLLFLNTTVSYLVHWPVPLYILYIKKILLRYLFLIVS